MARVTSVSCLLQGWLWGGDPGTPFLLCPPASSICHLPHPSLPTAITEGRTPTPAGATPTPPCSPRPPTRCPSPVPACCSRDTDGACRGQEGRAGPFCPCLALGPRSCCLSTHRGCQRACSPVEHPAPRPPGPPYCLTSLLPPGCAEPCPSQSPGSGAGWESPCTPLPCTPCPQALGATCLVLACGVQGTVEVGHAMRTLV